MPDKKKFFIRTPPTDSRSARLLSEVLCTANAALGYDGGDTVSSIATEGLTAVVIGGADLIPDAFLYAGLPPPVLGSGATLASRNNFLFDLQSLSYIRYARNRGIPVIGYGYGALLLHVLAGGQLDVAEPHHNHSLHALQFHVDLTSAPMELRSFATDLNMRFTERLFPSCHLMAIRRSYALQYTALGVSEPRISGRPADAGSSQSRVEVFASLSDNYFGFQPSLASMANPTELQDTAGELLQVLTKKLCYKKEQA